MLFRIALGFFFVFQLSGFAQYITGPRGGCYTLSSSGRKRYVDRSMCSPAAVAPAVTTTRPSYAVAPTYAAAPTASAVGTRSTSDQDAANRLLQWLKSPSDGEIERAVKTSLAKRLGLTQYLPLSEQPAAAK